MRVVGQRIAEASTAASATAFLGVITTTITSLSLCRQSEPHVLPKAPSS